VTYQEQLERWAAGESIHAEQCVPDFSCCKPELQAPELVRREFLMSDEERRFGFLGHFLGAAMTLWQSEQQKRLNVHIAPPGGNKETSNG